MSYGKVHAESTVKEIKNYCSIRGEGYAGSKDLETARSLASTLADTVDHTNQMAYEAHLRSKGGSK